MAEYMTWERMTYLLQKAGIRLKNASELDDHSYFSLAGWMCPLYSNGDTGKDTKPVAGHFYAYSAAADAYEEIADECDFAYFTSGKYTKGFSITKEKLKSLIAQYPDVPPIPFFVGIDPVQKIFCREWGGYSRPCKAYTSKRMGVSKSLCDDCGVL